MAVSVVVVIGGGSETEKELAAEEEEEDEDEVEDDEEEEDEELLLRPVFVSFIFSEPLGLPPFPLVGTVDEEAEVVAEDDLTGSEGVVLFAVPPVVSSEKSWKLAGTVEEASPEEEEEVVSIPAPVVML